MASNKTQAAFSSFLSLPPLKIQKSIRTVTEIVRRQDQKLESKLSVLSPHPHSLVPREYEGSLVPHLKICHRFPLNVTVSLWHRHLQTASANADS